MKSEKKVEPIADRRGCLYAWYKEYWVREIGRRKRSNKDDKDDDDIRSMRNGKLQERRAGE